VSRLPIWTPAFRARPAILPESRAFSFAHRQRPLSRRSARSSSTTTSTSLGFVANRIATLITEKQAAGERTVLGLATGSTPIGVYRELIRMHRERG
jgi:hypothetical protein